MTRKEPISTGGNGTGPWPLERHRYTRRFRAHFPSTKKAINEAVQRVMKMATACGCRDDRQADLEISLREALANAIIHGNELHHAKRIYLRCYGAPQHAILIAVRDEGSGFDPNGVPDPREQDRLHLNHGRGLLLMRELMDHVEYRKDGREAVLFKICSLRSS